MNIFILCFLSLVIYKIVTLQVSSVAFVFSVLTLMLYIVPYLELFPVFRKLGYVNASYESVFFFYIFLCYCAFIVGDSMNSYKAKRAEATLSYIVIDYKKYEKYSVVVGIIGLLGYGYFIYKSGPYYFYGHNSGDFSVGGYVYELRYFVFSAVLLLFNALLKKKISRSGIIFLFGFVLFLCADAYIQQQRGSWIRFGVILMISYLFTQKNQKSLRLTKLISKYKLIFFSGIFLSLLLVITVQIRKFSSPNLSFYQQLSLTLTRIQEQPDMLIGGSGIDEGNEFVTAYNGFQANVIAGTYDYGLKWLYPFINFIPRALWRDKPNWFTFSTDIYSITRKYGNINLANGSAETGMIDAFYRFFWLTPLFFMLFGYYTRLLHSKAINDLNQRLFYICLYIGCFYFITQNMMPLIIFTLYMYIPIWVINKITIKTPRLRYV